MSVAVSVEYRVPKLVVADPDRVFLPRCRQLIKVWEKKRRDPRGSASVTICIDAVAVPNLKVVYRSM